MSRADVDDFLAELDDVVDDWEGSADSATWAADGSHEPAELDGDYYWYDRPVARNPYGAASPHLHWDRRRSYGNVDVRVAFGPTWDAVLAELSRVTLVGSLMVMESFTQPTSTLSTGWTQSTATFTFRAFDEASRWVNDTDVSVMLVPRQRFVPRDIFLRGMDRVKSQPDPWADTLPSWRTLGVRLLDTPALKVSGRPEHDRPEWETAPTTGPSTLVPIRRLRHTY